jgi:gliding motility-associated-like protein
MKKTITLLSLLFLLLSSVYSQYVYIGTATGTTTTTTPFKGLYEDARMQYIITASELAAEGLTSGDEITALAFNIGTVSSTAAYSSFRIKIAQKTATSFSSATFLSGGFTTVYNSNTTVSATGWLDFPFSSNITWDGTSSIIVETCFNNSAWTGSDAALFTTATDRVCYAELDGGTVGCSLPAESISSSRPNMRLTTNTVISPSDFTVDISSTSPTATSGDTITICQGTSVTFDATVSGTYTNPVTYNWAFGDGTTSTGASVSHTFSNEGGYIVTLYGRDNTGSTSNNSDRYYVRVSTTPDFSSTVVSATNNEICLGSSVNLSGDIDPVTIETFVENTVAGETFLPDGSGVSYTTGITHTIFDDSQTITDTLDIESICVNMEHSYMGDLSLTIECPNGSVMTVMSQNGGGAILGEPIAEGLPIDGNSSNTDPGVGYDYCFSSTATSGHMYDTLNHTNVSPYTDGNGNVSTATVINQINSGTYEIDGDWGDLIGCPLNGDWTITVRDHLSADNGYIFSWGLNFNPDLLPDFPYTDTYSETDPSVAWSVSPGGALTTINGDATHTPTSSGVYDYSIEITDGFSCTYDTTISVTVSDVPTVNAGSNASICGSGSYTLSGASMGGNASSVTWTNGSGDGSFDNVNAVNAVYTPGAADISNGSVTLTITTDDPPGECSAATDNMVLQIDEDPTVDAGAIGNICSDETFSISTATMGGGATSVSWSNGSGDGSFSSTNSLSTVYTPGPTDIATGTVTLTITGSSPGLCSDATDNTTLNISLAPTVSAGSNASICADETYTLGGSFGGGASSVLWTTSGDGSFDDATSTAAVYTPAGTDIPAVGASVNTVTLTLTTDDPTGPCSSVSSNMTLTINPMEDASFSYGSGTYCTTASDPSPTISGVGGGTFSGPAALSINPSSGLIDVSASTIGGPYTVTYTTPGTCTSSSTFDITITSGADAQFTYTTPICNSGANPLPAHTTGSNGTYSSTAGLVFVNAGTGEINLSASTPGTYTITNFVDLGACGTDTETFDITIDEAAEVFAGNNQTLCESDLSYGLVNASSGGSTSSITWTGGTGSFANANNINTNYVFGAGELGVVTLTVTTDDPAGVCPAVSDQIELTIQDAAEVYAGVNDAICSGETYTMSGTQGGSTSNITWSSSGTGSFDDNTSLTAVYTPSTLDISSGSVILTIASDDPSGVCGVVTDNMTLTINPLPTVTAGSNSPVCEGQTLNLTESGGNATAWTWTGTGSYNPADVQNPSQASAVLGATASYTVTGTITATGCSAQDVVNVTINPTPTVTAGSNSPICEGETLNLTETGGDADTWTWTSTSSYNPDDIQNPVHASSLATESGDYTVVGEISATGCTASSLVSVTINNLPSVSANADDNTVCEGTSVTLTGGGTDSYSWSEGVTDGVPFIPAVGTVIYVVTGTDASTTCSNTASISVTVSPMPTVSAGANASICEIETYTLNGSYGGGASSVIWSTSGDGTFDNDASLSAIYTPGSDDISNGSVTLTLTTDDPAGDCIAVSESMVLSVTPMDDAYFSYDAGTFCITGANPIPNAISAPGGTFSGSTGLVIDPISGLIDLTASGVGGPFTVTYTTNGTCPNASTFDVTITAGFDAEFYYDTPVCNDETNPLPLHDTGSNGIYSSTAGLNFVNTGTGEIDFSTSTADTYTITNTIAASGGCATATASFEITIDQSALVFAGNNTSVCASDNSYTLSTATMGGSTPSILWTSSGDGTFSDSTDINATYFFGASDIGTAVVLTVTTGDPATSCGVEKDSLELTIYEAPLVDAGQNDSICAGEVYTLSGTMGGSTSSVTWSTSGDGTFGNGNTLTAVYTPGVNDLLNNSVVLTVTTDDPVGPCDAVSSSMTLSIHDLPTITAGATTPLCEGDQLDLTETGGDADSWVWTGTGTYNPLDEQNPVLSSVYLDAAGTYTVIGTNSLTGCSSSDAASVVVQPVPEVVADVVLDPVCARENVELQETGSEADAWSWTAANGFVSVDQNPTLFNASADTSGWYYITGTISATGCSSVDSVEITVHALPEVSYTVDANDTLCFGEAVTLTGSGTADVYTWNNSVTNGVAFIPEATLTYTVLGEDANGCKDSVDVQVVVNPLPNVFAGNDQDVPYGGTTTINDATPAGLNYSWTPADSLVDASILHPTTVPLHIFNQFILLGTDPVTGCSNQDTVDITVIGGPLSVQLFASPNDSVCDGDAHYIYAIPSGGVGDAENFTFVWNDGNGGVYPNNDTLFLDTVSVTRTYTLDLTDEGVGNVQASIEIVVHSLPEISNIAEQDILCWGDADGSIEVTASGDEPLSYSIDGGITFESSNLFEDLDDASYHIVVQTAYGCQTDGGLIDINQPGSPLDVVVVDSLLIHASCGNANGSITVNVTGGTSPYYYAWGNDETGYMLDSIAPGDYVVTVNDENGCENQFAYTIANAGGGDLMVDQIIDVTCYGDSTGGVEVYISDGYPTFNFYLLQNGNVLDSLMNSVDSVFAVGALPSGSYTIMAEEGAGCNPYQEFEIGTNPEITAIIDVDSLNCWNDGSGSVLITPVGGVSPYSYSWTGTASIENHVLLLDAGTYRVTVRDAELCTQAFDNIVVYQPGQPDVNISVDNQEQCYGFEEGKITSVAIGGTPPYTYKWTNGSWSETNQIVDSLPSGDYHLLLTDINDCLIADTNITISDYPAIVISDSIYYYGARAGIELTVSGGTPAYEYQWEDQDAMSISGDSKIDNLINGIYSVTVSDFYGCAVSSEYTIEIPFVVPTLISPNDDGYNDTWQIPSIESYDNIHIEIYNRWGNIVFSFDGTGDEYGDVSNQFDGTYNGSELPIGSYVYVIDLKDGKEASTGTLSIIRTQ